MSPWVSTGKIGTLLLASESHGSPHCDSHPTISQRRGGRRRSVRFTGEDSNDLRQRAGRDATAHWNHRVTGPTDRAEQGSESSPCRLSSSLQHVRFVRQNESGKWPCLPVYKLPATKLSTQEAHSRLPTESSRAEGRLASRTSLPPSTSLEHCAG